MRLVPTCFAATCLAFASLAAAYLASQESVSAQFVSDAALARAFGTNGTQQGGGNGSYSCSDVNATSPNFSAASCMALTAATIPANAKCVWCSDVNGTGYTTGTGTVIVYSGQIDCTNGGSGSKLQTADCTISLVTGFGTCGNFTPTGQCTGSFAQWGAQNPSE